MISRDSVEKLVYFQREVNKLFKTIFSNDSDSLASRMESMFPLPIDIYDEDDSIVFEMEVPGADPKNLNLYVSGDVLIIEGAKRENKREAKTNFYCMERSFGKFRRLVEIPITANLRRVKSSYKDGILRVTIEKISDRRGERREIPIEIEIS